MKLDCKFVNNDNSANISKPIYLLDPAAWVTANSVNASGPH